MSLTGWLVEAKIINSSSDHWLVGDPKLIPVDILTKVLCFLESRSSPRCLGKNDNLGHSDRVLTQNFDAVLAVIVI